MFERAASLPLDRAPAALLSFMKLGCLTRGLLIAVALAFAFVVVELATWAWWKGWMNSNVYGGLSFDATGRRARLSATENRWDHNELHVVWRTDGTVDRKSSYRSLKRFLVRRLSDEEVARFESTEWGARADTYFLACAIRFFERQTHRPPSSLDELLTLPHAAPRFGGARLPRDRWGRHYQYEPPTDGRPARIFTLGADGRLGGDGADADWFGALAADGAPTWLNPLESDRP